MPHTHTHAHTQTLAQHPLCRLLCEIEAELVKLLPQIPDSKSGRGGGQGARPRVDGKAAMAALGQAHSHTHFHCRNVAA